MSVAPARRTLADLALVVAAKVLSVAALFLCSVLAARELGAAAYGHFAAALSLLLLVDAMAGSPLDLAVIRFGTLHATEPARVATLQTFLLRAKLAFAAVVFVLAWPNATRLTALLLPGADNALFLLLVVCIGALLLLRGYAVQLQVAQRFRLYAALDVALALLRIGGVLVVWWLVSTAGAFTYFAIYAMAAFVVLAVAALRMPQGLLRRPMPGRADLRALGAYVAGTAGIVVLGTVTGRADVPLVSAVLGAEATGYYGVGTQLAAVGTMLATYVGIVTQPRVLGLARAGQLGRAVVLNAIGAGLLVLLLVLAGPTLLPLLVPWLFGDGFAASLPVVEILLWGTCIDFLIMPFLLPYALQLETRNCLRGEFVITMIYLLGMLWALGHGIVAVAWLVTGIRLIKLCFYSLLYLRTHGAHASVGQQ